VIVWLIELRIVKDKTNVALRTSKFLELKKNQVGFIISLVEVGIKDIGKNVDRGPGRSNKVDQAVGII